METEAVNPYATPEAAPEAESVEKVRLIPGSTWIHEILKTAMLMAALRALTAHWLGRPWFSSYWAANAVTLAALLASSVWMAVRNRNATQKLQRQSLVLRGHQIRVVGPAWGSIEGKRLGGSLCLTSQEMIFIPKDKSSGKLLLIPLNSISKIGTRPWLGFHLPATLLVSMSGGQVALTVALPGRWNREIGKLAAQAASMPAPDQAEIAG